MTNDEVISEIFKRTRISVDKSDPVLIILALANIILENQSDFTAERVAIIANGFERTAEKTSTTIVETLNKAAGILQLQLNEIEAAKKNITVPELLEVKYLPPVITEKVDQFKERVNKTLLTLGTFALGSLFAFLVSGFMWVFFR